MLWMPQQQQCIAAKHLPGFPLHYRLFQADVFLGYSSPSWEIKWPCMALWLLPNARHLLACLNFPFLLVLWKMQQVPPWQHHCSPARVKGDLLVVSKSQGKKKGEATTFQREQQQGFRFQHWKKLSQPSWGGGSSRDDSLGQFPLRGGHWGHSPACQLLRERGRTGSCWSLKSKPAKVHSHLRHRYRKSGWFLCCSGTGVQCQREKKNPMVLPQQCHWGDLSPDHIYHDRCIPDFLLYYFNKEDFNGLIMRNTFPQLIHLVVPHIPLRKSIRKHHIYWHLCMDFPSPLRNISKIWPLSNL